MKKMIATALCFLIFTIPVFAETIYLKDGTITKGEITKTSEDSIAVKTKFGEITIPKSDIEKVEYDKAETQKESKIEQTNKENVVKYEKEKLGIRTVDVYYGASSSFGSTYYSKFLNMAFGSSVSATSLTPTQKWIITRGQFDITHLEFLRIVESERAITVEQRINELIKEKEDAYAGCWAAAIIGIVALGVSLIPLEPYTFLSGTYMKYGTLNWILLIGGSILAGVGFGVGIPLETEITALKQIPTDPLAHFDNLEYTQEKIDKYNKGLCVKFGISF